MIEFAFRVAVVGLLAAIWGALNRLNQRAYETNTRLGSLEYLAAKATSTGASERSSGEQIGQMTEPGGVDFSG